MFANFIGWFFYVIGLDFWTKNSKITVFISLILVPIAIGIYHLI